MGELGRHLVLELADRGGVGAGLLGAPQFVLDLAQARLGCVDRAVGGGDGLLAAIRGVLDLALGAPHGALRLADGPARLLRPAACGLHDLLVGAQLALVVLAQAGELLLEGVRLRLEVLDRRLLSGDLLLGLRDDRALFGDDVVVVRLDLLATRERGLVGLECLGELPEATLGGGVAPRSRTHVPDGRDAAPQRLRRAGCGPACRVEDLGLAVRRALGLSAGLTVHLVRHRGSSRTDLPQRVYCAATCAQPADDSAQPPTLHTRRHRRRRRVACLLGYTAFTGRLAGLSVVGNLERKSTHGF